MNRLLLLALAIVLLSASAVHADIPRPPPPPPPPPPGETMTPSVVAGVAAAVGLVLAGLWVARTRRRTLLQG